MVVRRRLVLIYWSDLSENGPFIDVVFWSWLVKHDFISRVVPRVLHKFRYIVVLFFWCYCLN